MNAQTKVRTTLSEAIAACMADITPLAKGETNSHGSYNFASIDDFLNLTRPICAKHQLDIRQDEEACEISGGQVFIRYAFTLHHHDETAGPYRRSIAVNAKMGSQAFGAAQSYALKQFLRSLFQISTGEKDDIDYHKPEELADQKPAEKPKRQPAHSKLKTELRQFVHEMHGCGDADELNAFLKTPDALRIIRETKEKLPHLWDGEDWPEGQERPGEFVPLCDLIEKRQRECAQRTAEYLNA